MVPTRPLKAKSISTRADQRRNGQRVTYEKPKGMSASMLADLAKSDDASKYIKARKSHYQGERKMKPHKFSDHKAAEEASAARSGRDFH